jgi:hypothetical protein
LWIFVDGGIGFPTLSLPPGPDQSAIYAAMATTAVRSGFWGPHSSTTAVPLGREDLWPSMAYGPFPPSVKGVALLPLICRGSLRPWLDSELINRLEKVLRALEVRLRKDKLQRGQGDARREGAQKDGKGGTDDIFRCSPPSVGFSDEPCGSCLCLRESS